MNPFDDDFGDFEPCWDNSDCPYQPQDFVRFTNAPAPLPLDHVRGSVVLVAGPSGHGKSVYGHRLLHEYQAQGLTPIELLPEGPFEGCLARRRKVLGKLRAQTGALRPGEVPDAEIDDAAWADGLRKVMGHADRKLVVRLPCIMQGPTGAGDRLAWEICQYAMAAGPGNHVFVYEYNANVWPDDWDRLRSDVERHRDAKVRACVLDPVAPGELLVDVQSVMAASPHARVALESGMSKCLKYVLGADLLAPASFRRLMRLAADRVIAEQSTEITLDHLMDQAMRIKKEAA
ncbi:hypothetical protein HUT06_33355 [Actinomadura sp. NAK00032]|uniref:hypothetical protein n=1 Tax=Actinomadura sp. NAK00032 TaxID=2742128 RepID=UPI0015915A90|nr:hypothetical protein [Actinomadura sp. NAK00032]QKW38291.1 hypothetical protein HUT06_33355 [Actinomadura sp. NAK00032]